MSLLGLTEYSPLSPLEPERPEHPRSAAFAFLISIFFPGIGQVYAKRKTAGWITFTIFFLSVFISIGALLAKQTALPSGALFVAVSLYIFSFLDAYFSVLEYNRGISTYLIGGNPRIAAVLNFLTNGFGYFYLGDRGKGIVMVIVMLILRSLFVRVFGSHLWMAFLLVFIQAAFAFDAHRIARKRLLESFPQLADHSWRTASRGQLSPAVPISFAIVVLIPVVVLIALGGLAQTATDISLSSMDVQTTPNGTEYKNNLLGLRLLLPDGWEITPEVGNPSFYAHRRNGACQIILIRNFSFVSPESFQAAMERHFAEKPGFSVYGHTKGTLGRLPAALMRVGVGTSVTERIATAKVGFAIYTLIGVTREDDEDCPAQLDQIKDSFTTKR